MKALSKTKKTKHLLSIRRSIPPLAVAALLCFTGFASTTKQNASALFKEGIAAESRDDVETAYACYRKAFEKEPANLRYKTAYERARVLAALFHAARGERLEDQGQWKPAVLEFMRALEIDPSNQRAEQGIRLAQEKLDVPVAARPETPLSATSLRVLNRMRSPVELKPLTNEPITLHMAEDSKTVYQTLAKLGGINVIFDPDYSGKRVSVDLSKVSMDDALSILGTVSGTFWRPVTPNTIFVAQNTRAKRTELEQQGIQTLYLSNVAQQNDLNDIQTALRNVLPNAKLYSVPSQSAIVMRATPSELLLAQKLIDDLDKAKPEVVVDVAVLEVSRDKLRNIGIQWPQNASVTLQATTASSSSTSTTTTSSSSSSPTLNTLAHLNASNFAVTLGEAQAELLLTDSDTKVLQNPRVRATDGQQATLKIGSRIPIATGTYTAATASTSSGTQTQFQYIDVGVNIDMKPTIHYDHDVTLKLKIEVSSQSGSTTISGVTEPIISQRQLEQVIRLKEGEANIVGGLLQRSESLTVSGTPGLGEVPILKYLFSTQEREVVDDEIVFMLVPHVVRGVELSPLNNREIDSGTGSSVEVHSEAANAETSEPTAGGTADRGNAGDSMPFPIEKMRNETSSQETETGADAGRPSPSLKISVIDSKDDSKKQLDKDLRVAVGVVGAQDLFSLPIQVHYDAAKLTLVGVDPGDFLGRDGQTTALTQEDDGNGEVTITASRPPSSAGVSGAGQLCVLRFKPKVDGDTVVKSVTALARNSRQETIRVQGNEKTIHVE